uniref:C-type lectin domain-containing protein n=1 Tax=Chelonoidis abingdonii TaxID=106734 RepID=A0A8C0G7F0_CHEAB
SHHYNPTEMSEQEVTYTELKFHTPSKQERIQRPKTIKNKGTVYDRLLSHHFLFQTPPSLSLALTVWQHGNSYYHYSTDWMTWQRSKDYCTSLGSNLLKIDSREEWVIYFPSVSSTILSISRWVYKTGFFLLQPSSQMQLIPVHHQHTVMHVAWGSGTICERKHRIK